MGTSPRGSTAGHLKCPSLGGWMAGWPESPRTAPAREVVSSHGLAVIIPRTVPPPPAAPIFSPAKSPPPGSYHLTPHLRSPAPATFSYLSRKPQELASCHYLRLPHDASLNPHPPPKETVLIKGNSDLHTTEPRGWISDVTSTSQSGRGTEFLGRDAALPAANADPRK